MIFTKGVFIQDFIRKLLFMVDFVNNDQSFVNYAIFYELCDQMRSEVDCAKSHHCVISEGLLVKGNEQFLDNAHTIICYLNHEKFGINS